jgi:hypothetical protein
MADLKPIATRRSSARWSIADEIASVVERMDVPKGIVPGRSAGGDWEVSFLDEDRPAGQLRENHLRSCRPLWASSIPRKVRSKTLTRVAA